MVKKKKKEIKKEAKKKNLLKKIPTTKSTQKEWTQIGFNNTAASTRITEDWFQYKASRTL